MKKIITAAVFAALTLGLVGGTAYAADRQKQAAAADRVAFTPEDRRIANEFMVRVLKERIYNEHEEQIKAVLNEEMQRIDLDYESLKNNYYHDLVHVVSCSVVDDEVRYTYFIALPQKNSDVQPEKSDYVQFNHLYELNYATAPLEDFVAGTDESRKWFTNNVDLNRWD